MEYKVLIKLFVPEIDETYELYIPVNKFVGDIAVLLTSVVRDLSHVYPVRENALICNRLTGQIYPKDYLIRQTNIRNGTELVLL